MDGNLSPNQPWPLLLPDISSLQCRCILAIVQPRREPVFSRSEDVALLFGRLFVAALFLPSVFKRSLAMSSFAGSLGAKGLPYPGVIAAILVTAEVFGTLALIVG